MTYKVYNRVGSGGFAVEAALTLAGAPHEMVILDSKPSTPLPDSFRKVNPWGQVPALTTKDGTLVTETGAILIWLSGRHTSLGPDPWTDDHATFVRWIVFMSTALYEGVLRQTYPDRYTTAKDGGDGVSAAAAVRNHEAFKVLENHLEGREALIGTGISAADIYLAMLTAWHMRKDDLPNCVKLANRVVDDPAIAPVWQKNFAHRLDRKWA
ncbi:MAG: glutathione S-transferase family protein [Pseudomonadota bacterium]